jgi:ribosomal protein S12 methylthiotransferase
LPDVEVVGRSPQGTVEAHIQGNSAYLKIADGCRRPCAFCAIPKIKGTAVSRPLEDILDDVRYLQKQGVREINLIAQDTTDYGHDLGQKDGLAVLLKELTRAAPDVDWIRILYAYPGYITDRLIEVMAANQQILPYIDIPLQHADPGILKSMRRPANMDWVYKTVEKLRKEMSELALRTTFIVGYPGETEKAFGALLDFIKEVRFDRVGVFEFSFEPGTTSETLGDPVPAAVKTERKERLMLTQQRISLQKNQALVGKTLDVLIEGQGIVDGSTEVISLGRTYRDAPEIDGMVIVEGEVPEGEITPVRITGAMTYDLTGVPEPGKLMKP